MDSKGTKSTDLREASFSYLTRQEENFVLSLTDQTAVQFTHPAPGMITASHEISIPVSSASERSPTKDEEGEISVFGAERYFNVKLDDDSRRPRNITDNNIIINSGKHVHEKLEYPVGLQRTTATRPKGRLGTPSVSSGASWNSQTALLPNSSHNNRPDQKANERWFFTGFACNGSCSDKKSVYVDRNIIGHRSGGVHGKGKDHQLRKESARGNHPVALEETRKQYCHHDQSRVIPDQVIEKFDDQFRFHRTIGGSKREEEYFVVPCVNSGVVQNLNVKRGEPKIIEDDPRKSLEVFGSHILKREDIALNLERKLSVLTWDAIPTTNSNSTSCSQMCEDIESEGSSDLFEIENLSGSSHVEPIFTKLLQTSDGLSSSSCMAVPPTSRYVDYEPSESSIEWSVVTASAAAAAACADFSAVSVLDDDYDEKMLGAENNTTISSPGGPGFLTSTVPKRSRPSGLLGCKNQKAVDVAEAAYKRNDRAKSSSHLQQLRRTQVPIPILRKLQPDHEHKYGERF